MAEIAEMLFGYVSPEWLRDRAIFELWRHGLEAAEVTRIGMSDTQRYDWDWRIRVDGRRRSGGNVDPPRLIEITATDTAAALHAYATWREDTGTDDDA